MNSAIERLLGLRVKDIMNTPVVTVSENATMAEAAALLTKQEITGAPVVDVNNRCIGIISTTDFALRVLRHGSSPTTLGWEQRVLSPSDVEPLHIECFAEDRVGEHMSPAVQTVSESASLINAARIMCREHIHRLVIIDADERPVGMVSSLDLVAALIAAVEE